MTPWRLATLAIATSVALAGCGEKNGSARTGADAPVIRIDGSSTVFPIAEAVAEEFQVEQRGAVRVTVGLSGTGGGFKKLCRGDVDISNASRPILAEEMEMCRAAGIGFMELPVAFDAITVVVNSQNDWVKSVSIEDLRKMWEPEAQGRIGSWNQIRPEWPDAPLMLFGPGADSGTFDYFTEAVMGKAKSSRGDYTASEDDNVLVQGVENNKNALGYFGYAHYASHKDRMRAVPIEKADGTQTVPSKETVLDGSYQPLSRPLFIYVSDKSAQRPEVRQLIEFYLTEGPALAEQVGFVSLPEHAAQMSLEHFKANRMGTVFGGVPEVGVTIDELLKREAKL
ncbi:PstS family phosphate ABC transporter substrate-binding protein [Steroidobacter sp. S1-65]|uniref:Phosphate-binding protein n=1 Tax=Steroidobacter gossypii TaxID=2805490 RepID=A0ABS1WSC4_9GAMM|nr:PstS family phosphate ABC transporter substrate-binding protein [Steroidobacter gossypii]MBM0103875.1 PstS family phosphate ABC transporter substrate-binding protein [Steroidobacter gossypii]